MAVAALLAIGVTVGLILPRDAQDTLNITSGSVTIERHQGRIQAGPGMVALHPGDRLLTRHDTNAHITTTDGDRLALATGTALALSQDRHGVTLNHGSLTAEISKRAANAPFVVRTPRADLTVLGTRFTVEADDVVSLLAVDHGRVRLTNRDDAAQIDVANHELTATSGKGELVTTTGNLPPMTAHGLTGDYFDHHDFTGWRLRRIDQTIDFDWGFTGPHPLINGETFSVRWRGWLVPQHNGPCTFTLLIDDGVRLWLDDKLVLDEWHLTKKLEYSTTITLEAGRAYRVRLDYYNEPTESLVRWYWSADNQTRQVMPATWLRPVHWTPPTP